MLKRYRVLFTDNNHWKKILLTSKYSTIPAAKESENANFENYMNEGLATIKPKNRVRLPARPPFVKNFFLGKVDTDLLAYPQLSKDDVDELENVSDILHKISGQSNPSNFKEVLNRLKNLRCLGLQCPIDVAGRELNTSETCKFYEVLLNEKFKYNLLNNELGIFILSKYGTNDQKTKYLEKLMDGSISSTVCIGDNSLENPEKSLDKTFASQSGDFKTYVLNGRKRFIINGENADLFIVFSHMEDSVEGSFQQFDTTAFLIDRNTPGVSVDINKCKDSNIEGMSSLIFNNSTIPAENVIGVQREGQKILSVILSENNINFSILSLNILKKLCEQLSKDILNKSAPDSKFDQAEAITSTVGEILTNAYIVESMIYLTSGIMSTYENPDCELEALITRIFSSELALKSTEIALSITGISATEMNHFCQKLHQNSVTQFISCENENLLRIMIALMGVQHTGKNISNEVKKLRNPLFNGMFILKNMWKNRSQHDDKPALDIGIKNYLHPSCQHAADELEYSILRLRYATELCLGRHGIEILNKHCHLRRLANSIMQIYAMTACLSRASRSYCIGLEHAALEVMMASWICYSGRRIVKQNVDEIISEYELPDKHWKMLTDELFKKKDYPFSHPLSRNF